jgi:predicted phosphohydrolase
MDIFGPGWENHAVRLADNWRRLVARDDIVLIPGDISWGLRLADALPDLEWLAALPGQKALIRGNHDYWWRSPTKLAALKLPGLHFIQNNHVLLDGVAIGGTRLWDFPFVKWRSGPDTGRAGPTADGGGRREDPEKIRAREILRLEASLASLPASARLRVALTHYPPLGENGLATPLTDHIGGFNIDYCVFGHIHAPGLGLRPGADCRIGPTRYRLASSDHVGHEPLLLAEV